MKILLDVGCGPFPLDGYIGLDPVVRAKWENKNRQDRKMVTRFPLLPPKSGSGFIVSRDQLELMTFPTIITGSMTQMPIASGVVDHICCSHALEHLDKHEVPRALAEFYRVLAPGGSFMIEVPDLVAICELYAKHVKENKPDARDWPMDTIFGNQDDAGQYHKTGFTPRILRNMLETTGFKDVRLKCDVISHSQPCIVAEGVK